MKTHSKFGVTIPNDYLVYTAHITQTALDDPIATVFKNTIGNIDWTYDNVGTYAGTLTGAFTADKTWLIINQEDDVSLFYIIGRSSANVVKIKSYSGGVLTDGTLFTSVEIRVYP